MLHGCVSFPASCSCLAALSCLWWLERGCSGGECEDRGGVLVFAEVVALVLGADVVVPVGFVVAAGGDGAHPQDGLGSGQAPAGAGDAHAVADEVAAGAFDDAGGDRPSVRERRGVVQVRFLVLQVAGGFPDVLRVLAAGPGRISGGPAGDAGGDAGGPAGED